jgi:hypothetical protein
MEVLKLMPNQESTENKGNDSQNIMSAFKVVSGIFAIVITGVIALGWFLTWEKLITIYVPTIFILILLLSTILLIIGKLQGNDFMQVVHNLFNKASSLLNFVERIFPSKNNTEQNNKTDGKN